MAIALFLFDFSSSPAYYFSNEIGKYWWGDDCMQTKNASPKAKKCQEHEKGTIIVSIDSFKVK